MKLFWQSFVVLSCLLPFFSTKISAYYTKMPASVVIGQPDFTSNASGTTQSKLNVSTDGAVFVDPKGRLIVADHENNRVLVWNQVPTSNNAPADLVLGQPDFTSSTPNNGGRSASTMHEPRGAYSDGNRLFVVDRLNGRVLIWNTFPTENGQPADVVVGQANMTTVAQICSAANFNNRTSGVWVHENKLFVTERNQNRVLIWNEVPTTNYEPADIVLGQSDFTTCVSQPISSSSFQTPHGVSVDREGRLYVADSGRNRILVWNTIPTENNTPADLVIGQVDFISSLPGIGRNRIGTSVANVYSNGSRLFVSDTGNNRILIFNTIPTESGAQADIVLGQPDFSSSSGNGGGSTSSFGLYHPSGIFEKDNRLYVLDRNHRILVFDDNTIFPNVGVDDPKDVGEGRREINGRIIVPNSPYDVWKMEVSVNGGGYSSVKSLENSTSQGDRGKVASFTHEFDPWDNNNGERGEWLSDFDRTNRERGFTLAFRGFTNNADATEHLFYFSPFTMEQPSTRLGASPVSLSFRVNSDKFDQLKEHLSHYQLWGRQSGENGWTKLADEIPIDFEAVREDGRNQRREQYRGLAVSDGDFEDEKLVATYTQGSTRISVLLKDQLPAGRFEIRAAAVDKSGHIQSSNTVIVGNTKAFNNPHNWSVSREWFPLQVDTISGSPARTISTTDLSGVAANYSVKSLTPTFKGIAFSGATIAMTVTDTLTGVERTSSTTATDSRWSLTPPLYQTSIITLSVYDEHGHYNELPEFELVVQ